MASTEPEKSRPPYNGLQMRMAILDGPTMVARIRFVAKANGEISVDVSGDQPKINEILDEVRQVAIAAPKTDHPEKRFVGVTQAAAERLRGRGYTVQEIPLYDKQLTFQIDPINGFAFAQQKSLHEFDNPNDTTGRLIQRGLLQPMSNEQFALAKALTRMATAGDHAGAAQAAVSAKEGLAYWAKPTKELVGSLEMIQVEDLPVELRKKVRQIRFGMAAGLQEYEIARLNAEAMLREDPEIPMSERANLESVFALAAAKRGNTESALSIWRRLLQKAGELDSRQRGWIWRNVSVFLDEEDPEARLAAQRSADAFLEAGDKLEAGRSMMRLSRLLERVDPVEAIAQLDSMIEITNQTGLIGNALRASIHHSKADRLLALHNYSAALDSAMQAISLWRGVVGTEGQLSASLYLAALQAKHLGKDQLADELVEESEALNAQLSRPNLVLGRRLGELTRSYNREEAEKLEQEAGAAADPALAGMVRIGLTMLNPDLDTASRLQRLEVIDRGAGKGKSADDTRHAARVVIAQLLIKDGEPRRAVEWLKRAMNIDPLDLDTIGMLIRTLFVLEDWNHASETLESIIQRFPESPSLLAAYGESLLRVGNNLCFEVLKRALGFLPTEGESKLRDRIEILRKQALDDGLTPGSRPSRSEAPGSPVTRTELEAQLKEFADFVKSKKRMDFWQGRKGSKHKWRQRPEKHAQSLLHTFVKGHFKTRVDVMEELGSGAGRLDILLKLQGGLACILELKMCGRRYSSTYAQSGEGQIRHYMENENVHLGYLVAFDARSSDFGKPLICARDTGSDTVIEMRIDVRPEVLRRNVKPSKRNVG